MTSINVLVIILTVLMTVVSFYEDWTRSLLAYVGAAYIIWDQVMTIAEDQIADKDKGDKQ